MNTTHEKQANPAADPNTAFGRELQTSLLAGLLAGGGVGGLRYLNSWRKGVKGPKPKPKPDYRFDLPAEFDEAAIDAGYPLRRKAAMNDIERLLPVLGAGAGGLIGALRARPGQKMKGILTGAAGGGLLGAVGTAARSDDVAQRLGQLMSKFAPTSAGHSVADPTATSNYGQAVSPDPIHAGLRTAGNLALLGGGLAGGKAIFDHMSRTDKRRRQEDAVASARKDYFDALMGPGDAANEEAAVASKAASLDAAYDQYKKTSADGSFMDWLRGIRDTAHQGVNLAGGAAGLSALAGAGLGGIYMYRKTKNDSAAKRYREAEEARRRLRPLDTPWIDPEELAAIKGVVDAKSAPTPRIYNG